MIADTIERINRGAKQRIREMNSPQSIGAFVGEQITAMGDEHKRRAADRIQSKAIDLSTRITKKMLEAETIDEARLPATTLRFRAMTTADLQKYRSSDYTEMLTAAAELRNRGKHKEADTVAQIAATIPDFAIRDDHQLQQEISDLNALFVWQNNPRWIVLDSDTDIHHGSQVRFTPIEDYIDHALEGIGNSGEIRKAALAYLKREQPSSWMNTVAPLVSTVTKWHHFPTSNEARLEKEGPAIRERMFGTKPIEEPAGSPADPADTETGTA